MPGIRVYPGPGFQVYPGTLYTRDAGVHPVACGLTGLFLSLGEGSSVKVVNLIPSCAEVLGPTYTLDPGTLSWVGLMGGF